MKVLEQKNIKSRIHIIINRCCNSLFGKKPQSTLFLKKFISSEKYFLYIIGFKRLFSFNLLAPIGYNAKKFFIYIKS